MLPPPSLITVNIIYGSTALTEQSLNKLASSVDAITIASKKFLAALADLFLDRFPA